MAIPSVKKTNTHKKWKKRHLDANFPSLFFTFATAVPIPLRQSVFFIFLSWCMLKMFMTAYVLFEYTPWNMPRYGSRINLKTRGKNVTSRKSHPTWKLWRTRDRWLCDWGDLIFGEMTAVKLSLCEAVTNGMEIVATALASIKRKARRKSELVYTRRT